LGTAAILAISLPNTRIGGLAREALATVCSPHNSRRIIGGLARLLPG
jgi:hypothetical protein